MIACAIARGAPVALRRVIRTTTLPRPVDERTRPCLWLLIGVLLSLLLVLVAPSEYAKAAVVLLLASLTHERSPPFVSYGGTNLIASPARVGLLASIDRAAR